MFCPWCGKESQNEGTVVTHLQTMHYHLGLICAHCLDYFTTSADAVHQHAQLCKPTAPGDDDDDREEEDYKDDDNSHECDKFMFRKDKLHISCSHGKLATLHWCSCQGKLFLSSPSSDLNCSCNLPVSIL